ncbi:MAG: hypothetical protein MI924_02970 [Chloroflexales bacterium]|nr:hypothetical protein [Chloroflexales bacterium]
MKEYHILVSLVLILLTSCGSGAPLQNPATNTTEIAMSTTNPEESANTPDNSGTDTPEPSNTPEPTSEPTASPTASPRSEPSATPQEQINQVAPAGTVVLSEITPQPSSTDQPVEQPRPGQPNPLNAMVSRVRQDLSDRLQVDQNSITVIEQNTVEWSDSSLDCPSPDMGYAQVITPGYLIVLEAQGQRYEYHTDMQNRFVLCQDGSPASSS